MIEYLTQLFSSEFMPHGHCYFWTPSVLWVHVASDATIALSYYSIPVALVYFVHRRKDLAFDKMFMLFAAFIFACGTTHLMDVWTTWNATYRLEGLIKAATAIVSGFTAIALWQLMPKALSLPTAEQVRHEIAEKLKAQQQLSQTRDELVAESDLRMDLERALKEQGVLKHELDHRVKNTLALVMSLCDQTLSNSKNLPAFRQAFNGRLHALSRSHQLINRDHWGDVRIDEIVGESLKPYAPAGDDRVKFHGPSVVLSAKEAQSLHMVMHELATNAVKYGALRDKHGKVLVNWTLAKPGQQCELSLSWKEICKDISQDGNSNHGGFGTSLIQHLIEFDLNGQVNLAFPDDGAQCNLRWVLKRDQESNGSPVTN